MKSQRKKRPLKFLELGSQHSSQDYHAVQVEGWLLTPTVALAVRLALFLWTFLPLSQRVFPHSN